MPVYIVHLCHIVVQVHSSVRGLHDLQLSFGKKWYFLWWTYRQIYVTWHNWEFLGNTHRFLFNNNSPHQKNISMYRMSQKQIVHDKNIIIDINATHWEIKFIFSLTYELRIYVAFINLVHSFTFSLWLWQLHLTQHIGLRSLGCFHF